MITSFSNLPPSLPNFYTISLLLLPLVILIPSANSSVSFQISQFNSTNMYYQGDAVPSGGNIEFNSVDYINRVGWATYPERLRLWDSSSGKLSDFTSHFSFTIDTQAVSAPNYGHGLSFFLASVGSQIPPNSAGGFLGLFNTTTMKSSQNPIVSVEFDSYVNEDWDPRFEHVGINNNSIISAVYTPWNASFHSVDTAEAWITYNSTTKNLSVSWKYASSSNPRENSSLFYIIDLAKFLPEWVTVGFSAATGMKVERHRLLSWEFYSSLDIKETEGKSSNNTRNIIIGVSVSAFVLIAAGIAALMISRRRTQNTRRKRAEARNETSINEEDLERGAGPRRFSYEDLVSATNNFSDQRKLGEGGFGSVYKGYSNDIDMAIAVKKISRGSRQGKKEYITEVKTISQLRHRNLVQLIGWCHDKGEFMLVYEFMPNGSLDAHLFGKKTPLSWSVRYKISHGLASGLLYLHEEWEQCVIHRDIKSSNVMLDSGFNAKLGDFGLAKLMDHELGPKTTGLAGTFGYLAPEYIRTGRASKESDVYSFGLVALEIASGRKANDPIKQQSEMSLVEWIWDLYGCRNLKLGVDKRIEIDFDEKQAERLMTVGLWCANPDHSLRPSIRQALHVLNCEAEMPDLPKKMPVPVYNVPLPSFSSSEPPSITNTDLDDGR